MDIKMLTTVQVGSVSNVVAEGAIARDVPEQEAKGLIEKGYAEAYTDDAPENKATSAPSNKNAK